MNLTIANRLVELRQSLGLSQEALASSLGVSRQAVSKWERAEASPDTDNLIALANLYDISLDALLLGREAPAPQPDESPAWSEADEERAERKRRKKALLRFPYPVFITLCYLWLGFGFHLWHPAWLIFLTIPLYYGMAAGID